MARALVLCLAFLWAGCDSGGIADEALLAEGVVVEVGTDRPLADIVVQIRGFGGVFSPVVAADTTGPDGRFRVYEASAIDARHRLSADDLRLFDGRPTPEYFGLVTGGNVIYVERGRALTLRLEMERIVR